MARKNNDKPAIEQDPVKTPRLFDYPVTAVPFSKGGKNGLNFRYQNGDGKQLRVKPSEAAGKRLVVAWQVDTSQVPGETAVLTQIQFPGPTPFSYIVAGVEYDDNSGMGVQLIWKRIKRKGNVIPGVRFYYSVLVTTQDANGGTHIYVAEVDDPMVIVD